MANKYKLAYRYFELEQLIARNAHIIQTTNKDEVMVKCREENMKMLDEFYMIKKNLILTLNKKSKPVKSKQYGLFGKELI